MSLIIKLLSPLLILFGFSLSAQQETSHLRLRLQENYKVTINNIVNENTFSSYWKQSPLNAKAFQINEENEEKLLNILNDVFKELPINMITGSISNVYLFDSVKIYNEIQNCFSYQTSIYIPYYGKEEFTREQLIKQINRSIGVILFNSYPNMIDKNIWGKGNSSNYINSKSEGNSKEDFLSFFLRHANTTTYSGDIDEEYKDIEKKTNEIKTFFSFFHDTYNPQIYNSNSVSKTEHKYSLKINLNIRPSCIPFYYRKKGVLYKFSSVSNLENQFWKKIKHELELYPSLFKYLVTNIYFFENNIIQDKSNNSFNHYSKMYIEINDDLEKTLVQFRNHFVSVVFQNIKIKISNKIFNNTIQIENKSHLENGYLDNHSFENQERDIINYIYYYLYKNKELKELARQHDKINFKYNHINHIISELLNDLDNLSIVEIEKEITAIKMKYGIDIKYNFNYPYIDTNHTLPSQLVLYSNMNLYQISRSLRNIDTCLKLYPTQIINKHLSCIYLLEHMNFGLSSTAPGGTYSVYNHSLFLSNVGNSDNYLQSAFHHEFSSLLLNSHNYNFPYKDWKNNNDSDFSYIPNNTFVFSKSELYKLGIIHNHGIINLENDFNCYVEYLFCQPQELISLAEKYPKIYEKSRIVFKFYKTVCNDFMFNKELEKYYLK